MKKLVLLALFTTINVSFAMDNIEQENINSTYSIAIKSLNLLDKKAKEGDMASALAAHDFHEQLKNTSYKISMTSSKKLLKELSLIDDYGNIHKTTREAFEQFEQQKFLKGAYITATRVLELLDKRAKEGDMDSTLASYDFNEQLKNPSYTISMTSSKKLLQKLELIDDYGNIHKSTREAFAQYKK